MKILKIVLLSVLFLIGARVCAAVPQTHPGDVLLPTFDGRVVLFHPETGTWEDFAALPAHCQPYGFVREPSGDFLIGDRSSRAILRLSFATGAVSVAFQGDNIFFPRDLTLAPDGAIYDLDSPPILRIDPGTGVQTIVTDQTWIQAGAGIRLGPDGNLYVAVFPFPGGVFRINVATGSNTCVSCQGLISPFQIEFLDSSSLLVSNWVGNSTDLIRMNPGTGALTTLVTGISDLIPGLARDSEGGVYMTGTPWSDQFGLQTKLGDLLHFDGASVTKMASFPFPLNSLYVFPGSSPVPTKSSTWGGLKGRYR
jgi:hypothetical protein